MQAFSTAVWIIGSAFETTLLLRAWRAKLLSHFPLFYSYLAYVFAGSVTTFSILYLRPHFYPLSFWYYFLIGLLAEFAVLVEISDHIFNSYPAVRGLGRFLISSIIAISLLYILPGLVNAESKANTLFDLAKRTMLTKAVIVVLLFAAARYVGIPMGRNVAGMLLGFSLYLGINVANFALAKAFGPALYGRVFSTIGPLSSTLCLLVWTFALWRYEPVTPASLKIRADEPESPESLRYRLERFNTALGSLLRK